MDGDVDAVKAPTSVKGKKRLKLQLRENKVCRKLAIKKGNNRKKRKNLKKIEYIGSLLKILQEDESHLKLKPESKNISSEQTVYISDGESENECCDNSVIIQSVGSNSGEKTNKDCEVIDLTGNKSPDGPPQNKSLTVIDITDDEKKSDADDVSIIGTYKTSGPSLNLLNINKKLMRNKENWGRKKLSGSLMLNQIKFVNKFSKRNVHIPKVSSVGENVYVNSPVILPSRGLRPIIIDGSNVAYVRPNYKFCCKRLEICINYFKEKGHKVTAFVPQFRMSSNRNDNPQLLMKLERQGDVVLTPSKKVDGVNIVPYDDRFIVQTAVLKGGVIVSRDNYNDLLRENPAWAETIKYRVLAFTWVDDVLMFPRDPLGEFGPSLEQFLRFQ